MKKIIELFKHKWAEYFVEILVIIVGIFGAFTLNNWNEKRKQDKAFLTLTDQLYNSVYIDISNFEETILSINSQTNLINDFLNKKKEVSEIGISELFYLDTYGKSVYPESKILAQKLDFNLNNDLQNELSKKIFGSYLFKDIPDHFNFNNNNSFTKFLVSKKLPRPAVMFGHHGNIAALHDTSLYNSSHLQILNKLLSNKDFQENIKMLRSVKNLNKMIIYQLSDNAKNLLKSLNDYNPNLKLQFDQVQIIGSALKGFYEGLSMNKINKRNSLWKIKLNLTDGQIKFRNGNNWSQNRGVDSFPGGTANWFGGNINVKKGYYEIFLDLDEKSYSFKKLNSNNSEI